MSDTMTFYYEAETVLDKAQQLQDGLVARATGGEFDGGDPIYKRLRQELLSETDIADKVPSFVRRFRDVQQFWQFIQPKFPTYSQRREFIWDSFRPLIDHLEGRETPGVEPISEALERFDPETIHAAWKKALGRRASDPDGAITAARSLIESVCKHLLDDAGVAYPHDADLPKLWALCAETLNLAPSQHEEKLFKTILGNCQSIVNTLAALRNKIGDAHGTGRRPVKPKPRHAELAVNLAGAMASFLVATRDDKSDS